MATKPFPLSIFLARLLFSLTLVLSTYNPTGYSFYHWITGAGPGLLPLKLIVGLTLVMIYWLVFRQVFAAFRRSGVIVAALAALLFVTEVVSVTISWRSHSSWHFYIVLAQYVVLSAVAIVLSFGVSWSYLIERLTGQLQKRYVQR